MPWAVVLHEDFQPEFDTLPPAVRVELIARLVALAEFGPDYGRPTVDTLNHSAYANMKELRFRLEGVWRFAFAFDPLQRAIMLVGGNKEGENQKRFYKRLLKTADSRFAAHIAALTPNKKRKT